VGAAIGLLIIYVGKLTPIFTIFGAAITLGSILEIKEVRVYLGITKVQGDQITSTITNSQSPTVIQKAEQVIITSHPAQPTAQSNPPHLRVTPRIVTGNSMGTLGMEVKVANLGDGIAQDIQLIVTGLGGIAPSGAIRLQDLGVHEKTTVKVVPSVSSSAMMANKEYSVEVSYRDANGKEMPPVEEHGLMTELFKLMQADAIERVKFGFR
jgi:hypothetical protein